MLPLPDAHCRYIGEWTATKLRRDLAVDQSEAAALTARAEARGTTIGYDPAS